MTEQAPRCPTCAKAYVRRPGDECSRCRDKHTQDWRSK